MRAFVSPTDYSFFKSVALARECFSLADSIDIARRAGIVLIIAPTCITAKWSPHPMCYGPIPLSVEFRFNPADQSIIGELEAGASHVVQQVLLTMIDMMGNDVE